MNLSDSYGVATLEPSASNGEIDATNSVDLNQIDLIKASIGFASNCIANVSSHGHSFKSCPFQLPGRCGACGDIIWGSFGTHKGCSCLVCGIKAHRRCINSGKITLCPTMQDFKHFSKTNGFVETKKWVDDEISSDAEILDSFSHHTKQRLKCVGKFSVAGGVLGGVLGGPVGILIGMKIGVVVGASEIAVGSLWRRAEQRISEKKMLAKSAENTIPPNLVSLVETFENSNSFISVGLYSNVLADFENKSLTQKCEVNFNENLSFKDAQKLVKQILSDESGLPWNFTKALLKVYLEKFGKAHLRRDKRLDCSSSNERAEESLVYVEDNSGSEGRGRSGEEMGKSESTFSLVSDTQNSCLKEISERSNLSNSKGLINGQSFIEVSSENMGKSTDSANFGRFDKISSVLDDTSTIQSCASNCTEEGFSSVPKSGPNCQLNPFTDACFLLSAVETFLLKIDPSLRNSYINDESVAQMVAASIDELILPSVNSILMCKARDDSLENELLLVKSMEELSGQRIVANVEAEESLIGLFYTELPSEKVRLVLSTVKMCAEGLGKKRTVDELLAAVAMAILSANRRDEIRGRVSWHAEIAYIEGMMRDSKMLNGGGGYAMTTFEAALHVIASPEMRDEIFILGDVL